MSECANHWFFKKLRELVVGCVGVLGGVVFLILSCKLSNKILTGKSLAFLPFLLSPLSLLWPFETSSESKA